MRGPAARDEVDAAVAVEVAGDEVFDGDFTVVDDDLFTLRAGGVARAVDEDAGAGDRAGTRVALADDQFVGAVEIWNSLNQ